MDITALQLVWFGLIGVLWTIYLVLEGFDFGVGMLLPVLGRNDAERRVLINTIGPVWDGNEVWLLTAGGATFAAFPLWYSTLFSAFYLPLLLVLVALILRGMAFEYRGKIDDARWRARWDLAIIVGSFLPSLLWGVAFSAMLQGVDAGDVTSGPFAVLIGALTPYTILGGLTTVGLFTLHSALYLGLKTTGDLRERSMALAQRIAPAVTVVAGVWALWTQLAHGKGWTWLAVLVAAVCLVLTVMAAQTRREGLGFILTSVVTIAAVVLIFGSLYPDLVIVNGGESVTIANGSSTEHTLAIMTWVALVMTPVIIAYQAWAYWVFRHRIAVTDIPSSAGLKSVSR